MNITSEVTFQQFCVKNFVVNNAYWALVIGGKKVSLRNRNAPDIGAS